MANKIEHCDDSIMQKLPTLPEGKSRHFFVSYSCEERNKVLEYIDELERRFSLKCFYSDRDFQPGKDIAVNIKEGMAMSVKVLLFVSPSFIQSGWCKYETDAAFVSSMGCGCNCIVPVLLEECEIPPTLVTMTYIDATIPGLDIPSKIASSLLRPDTDDGMLGLNMKSWSKMYENGYCYAINGEREPLWRLRPAKYKFTMKQNVIDCLKLNKVPIPRTLLKTAFGIINNHSVMRSLDYRNRYAAFLWWILIIIPPTIFILGFVVNVIFLQYASRNSSAIETNETALNLSANTISVFTVCGFLSLLFFVIGIPRLCSQKKLDTSLQTHLWEKIGEQCINHNVLLLFSSQKNKIPTVSL